jgi:hypothetical protein
MTHESNQPAPGPGPGYEVRDTNVRAVVTFLVGLTLLVIVVQVALWGLLRGMSGSFATPRTELAAPATIPAQLEALHKSEDETLAGKGGVPVDEAMRRIAEKGLPLSAAGLTEADVSSHAGIPASKTTDANKDKDKAKDAPK